MRRAEDRSGQLSVQSMGVRQMNGRRRMPEVSGRQGKGRYRSVECFGMEGKAEGRKANRVQTEQTEQEGYRHE